MTGICRMKASPVFLIAFVCLLLAAVAVPAQDTTLQSTGKRPGLAPSLFYVHAMGGLGLDWYSSDDIQDELAEGFKIRSLGLPLQYGIRGGFRNIGQVQYARTSTKAHKIEYSGPGSSSIGEIPMKFKSTELVFKLNPLFWTWMNPDRSKPYTCIFLVYGTSTLTYRDDVDDGWEGDGTLFGVEYAFIAKPFTGEFGVVRQNIEYDTTRLFGIEIPYPFDASHLNFYFRIGVGIGY